MGFARTKYEPRGKKDPTGIGCDMRNCMHQLMLRYHVKGSKNTAKSFRFAFELGDDTSKFATLFTHELDKAMAFMNSVADQAGSSGLPQVISKDTEA